MYDKEGKIIDRREMLRVKLKSLAEESRIIRKEERKTNGNLRDELHRHRIDVVRNEARHTHLAYGLIRGKTLLQMESNRGIEGAVIREVDWDKVNSMIKRYGAVGGRLALAA